MVTSPAAGGSRPAAAFFDFDKTIIAKSAIVGYGPSFLPEWPDQQG